MCVKTAEVGLAEVHEDPAGTGEIAGNPATAPGYAQAVADFFAAQGDAADGKPTLVVCRTVIGQGAPTKAGGHDVHGAPLGASELAGLREALGWTWVPFEVPEPLRTAWDGRERGAALQSGWAGRFAAYRAEHPALAAEFQRRMAGDLPAGFDAQVAQALAALTEKATAVATRKASQLALDALAPALPELFGGSADLTGSNLTNFKGCTVAGRDKPGNHMSWGVREFGMAAALNGMALHGGFIPYGGTFLTFSDYSRNAIRMAALMKQRVIHVFTHDSIGLGEDGPTHQSVEHAASLRLIPNLDVWRPADTAETVVAWTMALAHANRPSALLLSRQALPYAPKPRLDDIGKGGYVLAEPAEVGLKKKAQAVIVATGSEVQLALHAQATLAKLKVAVRVVSMPSTTTFDRQSVAYKAAVLPDGLPRIAVEAGVTDGWWKYGCAAVIGIDTYGESAPAPALFRHFHFTVQNVVDTVRKVLSRKLPKE
mgnify:CR=1 FL=1